MRDLNDDLIVRIVSRLTIFISIWVPATGFANRNGGSTENFCTGIFNDQDQILHPQIPPEKLPLPYVPISGTLAILTLFFMISATIGRRKMFLQENDDNRHTHLHFWAQIVCHILLIFNRMMYRVVFVTN